MYATWIGVTLPFPKLPDFLALLFALLDCFPIVVQSGERDETRKVVADRKMIQGFWI